MLIQRNLKPIIPCILVILTGLFLIGKHPTTSADIASLEPSLIEPFTLTLISTADLQGQFEPFDFSWDFNGDGKNEKKKCGGLARLSGLVKQKLPGHCVILSSTGDDFMGPFFHQFHGKATIDLMGSTGYDLMALGNHELDRGINTAAEAFLTASFPVLGSDLEVQNTSLEKVLQKDYCVTFNNCQIAFFSLMTESLPDVSVTGLTLTDQNITFAQEKVTELKSDGADVIVALTHVGLPKDKIIAQNSSGIDVILGGHSHNLLTELIRINDTFIVNAGQKCPVAVRIDIPVRPDKSIERDNVKLQLIPLDETIPADKNVTSKISKYKSLLPEKQIIGKTTRDWNLDKMNVRNHESEVANLITDIIQKKFRTDIVLINAGSIRGKTVYPAGDISDQMIAEIDAFRNEIYLVTIPGKYIKPILERSAACFGEGGLLHPSGLCYTIDLSRSAQNLSKDDANDSCFISLPGNRVTKIQILSNFKAKSVEKNELYTIAVNSFLFEHAGDGYFWFKEFGSSVKGTRLTIYSLLIDHIINQGTVDPIPCDGRLIIID